MKIINITILERRNGNTSIPQIFGLGDNNKMYEWQYDTGSWKLFQVT